MTNKPEDITGQILRELNLARHFEMTIGMHAGFPPKPDPSSILHVMTSLQIAPERIVYVGDSGIDAATAQNAGIDFVWMSYGYDDIQPINLVTQFVSADGWRSLV